MYFWILFFHRLNDEIGLAVAIPSRTVRRKLSRLSCRAEQADAVWDQSADWRTVPDVILPKPVSEPHDLQNELKLNVKTAKELLKSDATRNPRDRYTINKWRTLVTSGAVSTAVYISCSRQAEPAINFYFIYGTKFSFHTDFNANCAPENELDLLRIDNLAWRTLQVGNTARGLSSC